MALEPGNSEWPRLGKKERPGRAQAWGCNNLLAVASCGFMAALGAITEQRGFWTNLKNALRQSQLLAICPSLVDVRACFPELLFPSLEVETHQTLKCPAGVFRGKR